MKPTQISTYCLCLSLLITPELLAQDIQREPSEPISNQTFEPKFQAEEPNNSQESSENPSVVVYEVPKSIENLTERYVWYHSEKKTIKGYRIELFSASGANSRNRADGVKRELELHFENLPAYVVWNYPNFEVECGDFRTKLEAERTLLMLKDQFPGAFVKGPDIDIYLPPTNPENREIKALEVKQEKPTRRIK